MCFPLKLAYRSECLLCTVLPTNLFPFHSTFPGCSNCFQTEQSGFTGSNTQESGSPPSWPPSQSFWSPDRSVRVISPNFYKRFTRKPKRRDAGGSAHTRVFIHSHVPNILLPLLVPFFLSTPTQALICKRSMGARGALRWEFFLKKNKYTRSRLFSGQIVGWQSHVRSRSPAAAAAAEARETPRWEDRWWSWEWAAEQHMQGVKKPITVNQASGASQGGKEGKLYPSSGPPELACRVQRRGNPLDVTYILIFMNALIAPLKALPWPGGGYLYKHVREAKTRGKDICWSPLHTEGKKNLVVILIATGNNYLAVDSGKRVTWTRPALITRCEGWMDVTDARLSNGREICACVC